MTDKATIDPVTTSVVVEAPVDRAWEVFTQDLRTWWPMKDYSVAGEGSQAFVEGRLGGRFYERTAGGEEAEWGVLTAWEPPERIAFTWHPGTPVDQATEVEVRFTPEGAGSDASRPRASRVGEARRQRSGDAGRVYDQGWSAVLGSYQGALKS